MSWEGHVGVDVRVRENGKGRYNPISLHASIKFFTRKIENDEHYSLCGKSCLVVEQWPNAKDVSGSIPVPQGGGGGGDGERQGSREWGHEAEEIIHHGDMPRGSNRCF